MLSKNESSKREIKNRTKLMNMFFWIAFFLSIGLRTIQATVLGAYLPRVIVSGGIFLAAILLLAKIFLFDRMTHQQLLWMTVVFFITLLVSRISAVHNLFPSMLLVIGCLEIPFKKIAKNYALLVVTILVIAYLTTIIGLTKNYSVVTSDGIRYAMGTNYPTDFAAHVFYLLCAYLYMRGSKINIIDLTIVIVSLGLVQYLTKAQADTIAISVLLGFLLIYIFKNRLMRFKVFKKVYTGFFGWAFILPGVFAAIIYWLTFNFTYEDPIYLSLNNWFTNRLALGSLTKVSYGIKLFGQQVIQNGWGGSRTDVFNNQIGNLTYFFIDSSYVVMLVIYGLIFTILVLCGLMVHLYRQAKKNNVLYIMIWIAILMVSIIDHHLLEIQYNIFLLGFFAYFGSSNRVSLLKFPTLKISELRRW